MPSFSIYLVCFCFLLDLSLSLREKNIKCASPPECRDGCTDGYRGPYCNRRCPRKCLKCHRYTGDCSSNCHDGHFGRRCSTRCYFCNKCDMYGNCLSEDDTEEATSFTTANSVTSRVTIRTRRLKASRNYADFPDES
ncbi:uncharacterized protein LOC121369237 [Gigantopelta aegis]|uniref:uncharacterized protein LOC121369237 n=1 Tax=Gigantopelta aegis TaxID=1735272 RepID=UPI001B88B84B|nr:uncharacterized protein LOC121369237 [Gigantopelta aegis]